MARYPLDRFAPHLDAIASRLEGDVLRPTAAYAGTRVAARATSQFMRDAKGEPKRRRAGDAGPLRIVTGQAARSLTGKGRDSVRRVEIAGSRMTVEIGSRAPGIVYNERRTDKPLASVTPAMQAELPAIQTYARSRFGKLVTSVLAAHGGGGTP